MINHAPTGVFIHVSTGVIIGRLGQVQSRGWIRRKRADTRSAPTDGLYDRRGFSDRAGDVWVAFLPAGGRADRGWQVGAVRLSGGVLPVCG